MTSTPARNSTNPERCESTSSSVITFGFGLRRVREKPGAVLVRVVGLTLAALLCQSFFWSPESPVALKTVVAGVALMAASRPDFALLAVAAIVPFGRVVSMTVSPSGPVAITEALVLAFLGGWLWNRLRQRVENGPTSPAPVLLFLFAAVVAASLLVDIGILRYWRDYWWPYLGQLFVFLTRDFLQVETESRPWAELLSVPAAPTAAILLEGAALTRAVQVLSAGNAAFGRRLLWTLAVAAVGTALLSVGMALQLSSGEERSLLSLLQTNRISVHVSKVNTAASSFVLFIPVLIGLGPWSRLSGRPQSWSRVPRWAATAAGSGLLLAAMWMTGTRAALIAGMIVAVGASAYTVMKRRVNWKSWRSSVAIVLACCVVLAFLGLKYYTRTTAVEAGTGIDESLQLRLSMWRTALAMCAEFPVFGIGIGQFRYQAGAFHTEEVLSRFPRFNAHNQFLEMAAEVGLVGGLLFVGMFAVILWRAWAAFRLSRDPALGGAIAGLLAFLITCLAGQPLFYDVVAFPFWMVLGVALAAGDASPATISPAQTAASRRLWTRVTAVSLIVLALSIPVRVWQGKESVNFALARYGFSAWHQPSYGRPYRLVRGDGTFFTYPQARSLKLPIRRDVEAGRNRLEVGVSLDGRRVRTLTLADDEWQTVDLSIATDANRRFRRIDLAVRAPAGVAAQVRVAAAEISHEQTVEQGRTR